ncbi:aspartate--ammonia ligase [Bacillus sp. 31A1R]|uniref:Aspartate--ammonia ligase n=1 Tax=Robertmurraya mangrovi TaxID=3098077 RepID=A0ABU5J2J3_9BACI|nr:aspartate--ammonia ligase [Bacillus sp. 31A1R]MDZ5473572.1 aspartate--ammonia ligase [Bacillus sp. 31A1R]
MKNTKVLQEYVPKLNLMETEVAIKQIKDFFESKLSEALSLIRVSAPILLKGGKGLNDNLNGVERVVAFDAVDIGDAPLEIVQSLAKWKRTALARYGFTPGQGLYTDMNAIRRDETLDQLHSIYVDQWDWEKVITKSQRTIKTLKSEVNKIYKVFLETEQYLNHCYPKLTPVLPEEIYFITAQELENLYPHYSPKEREDLITKQNGAVFIMQIGDILRSGEKHDGRSPDYDDWSLNGDILFWYPTLERAVEVSSMGIRVDERSLLKQLRLANNESRLTLDYHRSVLNNELPLTIGGGIGQSRLCMFFLKKVHIGEVQASVWNEQIIKECLERNIPLL